MSEEILALAQKLGQHLKQTNKKITTAESCTGGGLGFWITSAAGSSAWYERGYITYSNEAKHSLLDVQSTTLHSFGAVSEQTAREMAEGALTHSDADYAISVTGIAGPDGGDKDKPVGTVWMAYAQKKTNQRWQKLNFFLETGKPYAPKLSSTHSHARSTSLIKSDYKSKPPLNAAFTSCCTCLFASRSFS